MHPTGQGDPQARRQVAGPGPRDDVRADRRGRARASRRTTSSSRRATPTTRRTGSARTRRAARRSPARRPRWSRATSATRRRRSPRTCSRPPRTTSSGATASSRSRARPTASKTIQEVAFAAYTNLPEGMEAGLEGVALLRPAEHDLPVRDVRGASSRSTAARAQWKPLQGRRRRRLRRPDQPDDRRGADHGRPHRGLRDGGDGADHLRRGRQLHRLQLHRLPDPDRVGDAAVRALRDGDALAAPPDRREGRGRVGDGRLAGGVRERGRRRARARGRAEPRDAGDLRQGLGRR